MIPAMVEQPEDDIKQWVSYFLRERWRAAEDSEMGGWCVVLEAGPSAPSDGARPIAHFMHEEAARHIARVHNDWLGYVQAASTGQVPPRPTE